MNRRSFLGDLLKFGVGVSILPAALTYKRRWKVNNPEGRILTLEPRINPEWVNAPLEVQFLCYYTDLNTDPKPTAQPILFNRFDKSHKPIELKEEQSLISCAYPLRVTKEGKIVSPQTTV